MILLIGLNAVCGPVAKNGKQLATDGEHGH
jgi:hypothetical protein